MSILTNKTIADLEFSCHTHSYVGFCNFFDAIVLRAIVSCHTHSYVGFCNILIVTIAASY